MFRLFSGYFESFLDPLFFGVKIQLQTFLSITHKHNNFHLFRLLFSYFLILGSNLSHFDYDNAHLVYKRILVPSLGGGLQWQMMP